jgi:carboxypeptidase Q
MKSMISGLLAATALAVALPAAAQDLNVVNRINDEAYNRGEVVETIGYLTDHIGGRLTNSPAMRQAEAWTEGRFKGYGLVNVHKEGFDFGRGWSFDDVRVRMTAPRPLNLHAIPIPWTPGTNGAVSGEIVVAPMTSQADFAAWRGKLAGKIVLITYPRPMTDATKPAFVRYDDAGLEEVMAYQQPNSRPARARPAPGFPQALDDFLKSEGALAYVRMAPRENGLLTGSGTRGLQLKTPGVEVAAEDYRRLARLAKTGPVSLSVDTKAKFDDSDPKGYNVLGDIAGKDPKAGYVMAGAHLDSWIAGDGASDNGAGSAVVMEAARILKSLGVQPKRTIRFALWAGEEQGLIGSNAYVNEHIAKRPAGDPNGPPTRLAGFNEMKGYFNLDNGSGRIRGIYAEGNAASAPILAKWLAPYKNQGVVGVSDGTTGSTDHVPFARVGLPAYQFIQDPLEYETMVHHSSVDTFDHLRAADLKQASAVMAWMLWQAANSDEPLPNNVYPGATKPADPFAYPQ